jgi:glycosyltransferase involved in cell wall biosynthesis
VRILVATAQWFPDFKGGAGRVAAETSARLADRGHEIVVVAPHVEHRPKVAKDGRLTVLRALPRGRLPETITDVAVVGRLGRRLRSQPFDALLAHQVTLAVGLEAAGLTAPLLLVYHASARRELRFLRSTLPVSRRRLATYALEPLLAVFERVAVRRAARILLLSEYSRRLLESDHPAAATAAFRVSGGVDVTRFTPTDGQQAARRRLGIDSRTPLLLTVRRLEPRMGIEQLLYAIAELATGEDLALAIVGRGSLDAKLRELGARLGLSRSVRFVGGVEDAELLDWYRAADLFVLPTVAYEGFGLATAEALASGTPVVGTPVGATPELLQGLDTRLVARGTDAKDLAAAISDALSFVDCDFRARCREHACENFAWERTIVAWEEAIASLAAEPRIFS